MTRLAEGDRVRVTGVLPDDPSPLEVGDRGTVALVDDVGTAHVNWDSGRTLGLVPGDPFELIDPRGEFFRGTQG